MTDGNHPKSITKRRPRCTATKFGFLRPIHSADREYWLCGNWRDGCGLTANDVDGEPVFSQPVVARRLIENIRRKYCESRNND